MSACQTIRDAACLMPRVSELQARRLGLSMDQVREMLERQGGRCAIYRAAPNRLVVDHCHATGVVRGLLCCQCNGYLGKLEGLDGGPNTLRRLVAFVAKCDKVRESNPPSKRKCVEWGERVDKMVERVRPVLASLGGPIPVSELGAAVGQKGKLPVAAARRLGWMRVTTDGVSELVPPDHEFPCVALELIKRKGEGEPLEYILGAVDFMGCNLKVTPDVLIPRPETEILVSNIIPSLQENQVLFDLCTGSGCIGLALKQACPTLQVTLSDISPEALAIAAENAQRNELRVELLEGDLFAPFAGKKADIITCNPPYLAAHEERPADEPTLALVGWESGYEFFERIASEAPPYLNPGAKLFFEIGTNQGARIEEIFSESHWNQVNCEQDWAGHDRFFSLEFS